MRLKGNFKKQCMKQIWNFYRGGEGRGEYKSLPWVRYKQFFFWKYTIQCICM